MAEFELGAREAILKYSLINIRRLMKKPELSYEEKVSLISIIMQYLYAYYAAYGKRYKDTSVQIISDNFLHEFSDESMRSFIRWLADIRNMSSHYAYMPATIRAVNKLLNDTKLSKLYALIESGLPYDYAKKKRIDGIDPAKHMADE